MRASVDSIKRNENKIMRTKKQIKRKIVYSLDEIPKFSSEDEEREWWTSHDLAPELGKDVTRQQQALIQRLKAKYRYMPSLGNKRPIGEHYVFFTDGFKVFF